MKRNAKKQFASRIVISATALSILATGAVAFGAASAWALGNAGPSAMLRILAAPAREADKLPTDNDGRPYFEGSGLIYESARYLGANRNAIFWVAVNERNHVCLVEILTSTGDSAMSCVTAEQFGTSGVSSSLTSTRDDGEVSYVEAYLVPDSLRFADVVSGLERVTDYLVAGDSRGEHGSLTASTHNGDARLAVHLLVGQPKVD